MLIWLLALACNDPMVADTGEADTGKFDNVYDQGSDCVDLWLEIDGPDLPAVGDTWTVWMKCDGALLLGTVYMRFDPPEIATVDLNNAVFLEAGEATLVYQVGSFRLEQAVIVSE